MNATVDKISVYLRMIKFSHSVFALPFAFTSALLASSGVPEFRKIARIVVAMVGGRSGAMGMNRIIDRKIDSANPRTKGREIPRGAISVFEAALLVIVSVFFLIYAAYMLNPLCLKLSPLAIGVLIIYSYTKRFTWMSHFVLGLAIAAAPLGAWIAVRGSFSMEIVPMSAAVIFWLAGFDVLYALQDIDFDKKHGLYSIRERFGIGQSYFTFQDISCNKLSTACCKWYDIQTWRIIVDRDVFDGRTFSLRTFIGPGGRPQQAGYRFF